jgi:hypothetical protein
MTFTKCSEVSDMINDKWMVIFSMAINGWHDTVIKSWPWVT